MRQTDSRPTVCTRDQLQFTDGLLALAADDKSGIECPSGVDGDGDVAATLHLVVEMLM